VLQELIVESHGEKRIYICQNFPYIRSASVT